MNVDIQTGAGVSVIVPAKNEARTIGEIVTQIRSVLPASEIIVVDDGSSDDTGPIAKDASALVIRHDSSLGNGAAIKSGARKASGKVFVMLDADGQHDPADIPSLLEQLNGTCRLVVGARAKSQHSSLARRAANAIYNRFASLMSGQKICDLTSGFRAANADDFADFLPLLPNGFSYPTTSTMAFLRAGHVVRYVPINGQRRLRSTKSHIHPLKDGVRFLLIIFKISVLYAPLKVFFPLTALSALITLLYSLYTLLYRGDFTTLTGTLGMSTTVLIFLIGLVSEQITTLTYMNTHHREKSRECA